MQDQSRVRYSFWKALGDIGGLSDGLYLIFQVLIGPVVAAYFERDLLKDSYIDPKQSKNLEEKHLKLARHLEQTTTVGMSMATVASAVKRLQKVNLKMSELLLTCLCRSVRKHKGYKSLQRLLVQQTS